MSMCYLGGHAGNELRLCCNYLTAAQIEEGVRRLADFVRRLSS